MCTGKTHATQGAITGLAVTAVWPTVCGYTPNTPAVLLGAMLCAGGALLPDLDTPSSTASGSFGPVTDIVSKAVRGLSKSVFDLTATKRDRARTKGTHRGLTHTLLFAIGLGAGFTWLASVGLPAVLGIVFAISFLALRGLPPVGKNLTDLATAAGITGAAWLLLWLSATTLPAWWIGGAIGTGCLAHTLGDALTDKNVPLLAPIPLGDQAWRLIGTPRLVSFTTDGWFEKKPLWWLNFGALCLLLVNLTPGGHHDLATILTGHTPA